MNQLSRVRMGSLGVQCLWAFLFALGCESISPDIDEDGVEGGAPTGFTCPADFYGDGECDCGCSVADVDCEGDAPICISTNCSGAQLLDATDLARCVDPPPAEEVPAEYTCPAAFYGDGECDCGCGVIDFDCRDADAVCDEDNCPEGTTLDESDTTQCLTPPPPPTPPPEFICDAAFYGDGECDCGCGALDIDCVDLMDVCDADNCPDGTILDDADPTQCLTPPPPPVAPPEFTCNPTFYNDGECDCGCGVRDIDCADAAAVCDADNCLPGTILDVTDTTQCLTLPPPPVAPPEFTCNPAFYNDGECDCGCGVVDFDCADTLAACDANNCLDDSVPDPLDNTQCIDP